MSDGGPKKRKSKAWYKKQAYHNKRMKTDGKPVHRLAPGLKGFLVTCNDHEKDAVKETYNILNEYADILYGPEAKPDDVEGSDGDDIDVALAKELQTLKDAASSNDRRFQNSRTGAKNCIFIKTTLDDPAGLAHAIFTDLLSTKTQKSRHALRLLPVIGTCKANIKEIDNLAEAVLQPFFMDKKQEVTFTVNFKARNNGGIGRDMVISTLRKTILEKLSSGQLRFTYTNPQITIMVEVICDVACLVVAQDYVHFKKYNLVEVVSDRTPALTEVIASEQSNEVCTSVDDQVKKDMVHEQHDIASKDAGNHCADGMAKTNPDTDSAPVMEITEESEHDAGITCQSSVQLVSPAQAETETAMTACDSSVVSIDTDAAIKKGTLDFTETSQEIKSDFSVSCEEVSETSESVMHKTGVDTDVGTTPPETGVGKTDVEISSEGKLGTKNENSVRNLE